MGLALAFILPLLAPLAAAATPIAAMAVEVTGVVITLDANNVRRSVHKGSAFKAGETVVTGPDATVEIKFDSGARIHVDSGTRMKIKTLNRTPQGATQSVFNLFIGRVRSFVTRLVDKESIFSYETKAAICGVAGTDFIVSVPEENKMALMVLPKEEVTNNQKQSASETSICERENSWKQGTVYLIGTDPNKTRINVTSCHMTSVRAGVPPREPSLIPDSMVFDFLEQLPFTLPPPPEARLESEMMHNVATIVSVPLAQPDPATTPVRGADRPFVQGQALTGGTVINSGGSGLVHGSITLDIGR